MNTILIVASDDALRGRLMSALREHSVFAAPNDAEALKTLRFIEIDVVLRGGAGMPRDIEPFVAQVRAWTRRLRKLNSDAEQLRRALASRGKNIA